MIAAVYCAGVESIGDRIEELMRRQNIESANELGRRAGLPGQTITNIIRASRDDPAYTPRRATLDKLAAALGVGVIALEHGESAVASTRPDLRLEREPEHVPADDEVPLETAALRVMDRDRHTLRDLDAVRAAIRAAPRKEIPGADLGELALRLLDAARSLRLAGEVATPSALTWRVAVGRHQRDADVAAEVSAAYNAEAEAEARAAGMDPEQGKANLAAALAKKKARRGE